MKVYYDSKIEMFDKLKELSTFEYDISNEEMDLFTRCFKNYIGTKRNQYRKIVALIHRDKLTDNSKHLNLLYILKNKLSDEIVGLCFKVIDLCQNFLNYILSSNVKQHLFLEV